MKIRIADLITGTRILCSVALLFCPAFSLSFFVLYLASGLTDTINRYLDESIESVERALEQVSDETRNDWSELNRLFLEIIKN